MLANPAPGSPEPAEVDYCVENSGVRLPNCYRVPPPPRTARNPNGLQPDVTSVEFQSASALSATRRTPTVRSVSHATLDPAHSPTTVALDLTGPNMSTVKSHPAAVIDIGAAHVPDQQHPRLPRRLNAWRPAARTGTNPDSRWSAPWDFLHFGTERQRRRRPPPQPERRSHRLRLSTRTCRSSDARSRAPNGFSSADIVAVAACKNAICRVLCSQGNASPAPSSFAGAPSPRAKRRRRPQVPVLLVPVLDLHGRLTGAIVRAGQGPRMISGFTPRGFLLVACTPTKRHEERCPVL